MAWWEAGARILLAILIGLAIGYERERRNKPAGTRTHILVCLGAALIAVMENWFPTTFPNSLRNVHEDGLTYSYWNVTPPTVGLCGCSS